MNHHITISKESAACLLPTDRAGIQLRPVPNARGRWFHVLLDEVVVAPDEMLLLRGEELLAALAQPETLSESVLPEANSFGLAEQLRLLRKELMVNTHEDTDTLLTQLYEAEVALQSLRALENRALAPLMPPLATPLPMPMLSLKAQELGQQIGALQLASFGYYALPDFDARLFDNEGPLYPDAHLLEQQATGLVGRGLVDIGGDREAFELKDVLAANGLGLNDTSSENR